jgi:hypothetical protein
LLESAPVSRSTAFALATLLALAGAAAGCSAPEDAPCWPGPARDAPRGEVELGAGEDGFAPLAPDQDLYLERGPQGGYHFAVWPRMRGMLPDTDGTTSNRFTALRDGEQKIDVFLCPHRLLYVEDSTDSGYMQTQRRVLVIIDDEYASGLDGHRVLLRVEVLDADGRYALDERWIVARQEALPDAGPGPSDALDDAGLAWDTSAHDELR